MITIQPYGDTALLINFEQIIDRDIQQQVLALQNSLAGTPGIRYMIPAYCSLTIAFDLQAISVTVLQEIIYNRALSDTDHMQTGTPQLPSTVLRASCSRNSYHVFDIPICYDDDFALDLKAVGLQIGKTEEEIINTHLNTEFYVYMLGFMPGFAYMGDMPEAFSCQRKPSPRTHVPAGSVGLASRQTAIYPFESPGGWQIIGRTPLKMFDPTRDEAALLKAGDRVRFIQISRSDFDKNW